MSQTASAEPDLPYGGPYVTPGSWPVGPGTSPALPPSGAACPGTDPCVLTGQYDQHRNSTNNNAANLGKLAGSGDYSNFGLAYVCPVTNPGLGKDNEPIVAQPLYVTNVTTSLGTTPNCNTTACNMLVVGTLSDTVYAFDTQVAPTVSGGNTLWSLNLATAAGHCGGPAAPPSTTIRMASQACRT